MANKPEILTTLTDSHLFGHLKPEILKAISEIVQEVVVPPNTTIGTKGEKGKPCCLIASGRVKMFRTGKFGAEVELKKGGEGIRRVQSEEVVAFHWVVKGDEMRIHTKSGGTIVARMKGDLLEVRFPGPQVVYFKKIN